MRHEYPPLYAVAVAVVIIGLIVGFAFAGVSNGAVLTGTTVLAGLVLVLFLLGRRRPGRWVS